MKRQLLHRRSSIVLAVLAITLAAGALTSTASAMFRGPEAQTKNFSVTYVGVTGPVDFMPRASDLVLTQTDGNFVGGRRSEMTVTMLRNGYFGTKLSLSRPCGDEVGWCIDVGRQTWVVVPQMIHATLPMGDTKAMFGPAFIKQIVDGEDDEGYDGFATYRATVEHPGDTVTEGAIVTVNIDGYVSKMKTPSARR